MSDTKADVIVIAGTYDAKKIISELSDLNLKIASTITTSFANDIVDQHPNVITFQRKLTAQGFARMMKQFEAKCLIDASHPFAIESSNNAMKACAKMGIGYLRYEPSEEKLESRNVIYLKSFDDALKQSYFMEGNILLSVGSKNLETFFEAGADYRERLHLRVIPDSQVMIQCESAGIDRSRIFAIKGRLSEELNLALMQHMNIRILITKDSGTVGGTYQKIKAAERLGIKTLVIERPGISYTDKAATITEAVFWVGNAMAAAKVKEAEKA